MKYISNILSVSVSVSKRLLILALLTFILPLGTEAFISFPDKIDTLQERKNIQIVLNTVMSPSPNLTTDGVLGKKSIQAIQAFQEQHNLTPDGKIGPITRSTLESAQSGAPVTSTPLSCSSGATFNPLTGLPCVTSTPTTTSTQLNIARTLKLTVPRMTGNDIKELQIYLNANGYNTGIPDGVFGSGTQKAIILFQQSKNLTADGSVGPKTLSYLTKLSPSITTTGCTSSSGFNTLTGLPCSTAITIPTTPVIVSGGGSSSSGGSSNGGGSSTPSDTTKPIIGSFTIPTTATSLTVSISTFTATDAVGVTGYLLTETASAPSSLLGTWTSSIPTTYTFGTAGAKTLYAWAKDAAGNVSTSLNDGVTITLSDTTKPIVTAFTIPATATSLTIPITTFTASDNVGVIGYLLTETSTTPSINDSGWASSAPTGYTFGSILGAYKYNFTKDLKQGTTNEEVKQLQIYLNNHGYLVSTSGPGSLGKETNYFGLNTKQAVIKFQKSNNLVSDGIVGQNTRTILNK